MYVCISMWAEMTWPWESGIALWWHANSPHPSSINFILVNFQNKVVESFLSSSLCCCHHVEAFCCILLFRIWKRTEQRSLGSNEKGACPPLLYTCNNVANSPAHCVWAATKPCRLASSNNTVHTRIFSWSSYCIFWQTVAAETFTLFSYYAHFFEFEL